MKKVGPKRRREHLSLFGKKQHHNHRKDCFNGDESGGFPTERGTPNSYLRRVCNTSYFSKHQELLEKEQREAYGKVKQTSSAKDYAHIVKKSRGKLREGGRSAIDSRSTF